jgi:hypothetical protein
MGEIATACTDQNQGASQITAALSQMDKATQQGAAHAEETAGASEELHAQATSMKEAAVQLLAMVNGNGGTPPSSELPETEIELSALDEFGETEAGEPESSAPEFVPTPPRQPQRAGLIRRHEPVETASS